MHPIILHRLVYVKRSTGEEYNTSLLAHLRRAGHSHGQVGVNVRSILKDYGWCWHQMWGEQPWDQLK